MHIPPSESSCRTKSSSSESFPPRTSCTTPSFSSASNLAAWAYTLCNELWVYTYIKLKEETQKEYRTDFILVYGLVECDENSQNHIRSTLPLSWTIPTFFQIPISITISLHEHPKSNSFTNSIYRNILSRYNIPVTGKWNPIHSFTRARNVLVFVPYRSQQPYAERFSYSVQIVVPWFLFLSSIHPIIMHLY